MSFEKIQVRVSLNLPADLQKLSLLNVEIGYQDSFDEVVWKSNARTYSNKEIDNNTMEQATWKAFDNNKTYVFDFLESASKQIVIKQTVIYKHDNSMNTFEKRIDISDEITQLDYITINIIKSNI
jgi:hypothetical protein